LLGGFDEFPFQTVAVSDVKLINLFKLGQQLLGPGHVVPVTFQFGDNLTLTDNILLSQNYMASG